MKHYFQCFYLHNNIMSNGIGIQVNYLYTTIKITLLKFDNRGLS